MYSNIFSLTVIKKTYLIDGPSPDWGLHVYAESLALVIDLDFIDFKNILAFEFVFGVGIIECIKFNFSIKGVKFIDH